MLVGGEEPTPGTSQFKLSMNLKTIELNSSRKIVRPCGVGKALVEFKLKCGWLRGCSLINVGANEVLDDYQALAISRLGPRFSHVLWM
jgi:hypothetical protein